MKQIIAIIQPHRLDTVEDALHQLDHLPGFTLVQARGHARGHGPHHAFTDSEWNPDAHERLVLTMFCDDAQVQAVVEAIRVAAYTGMRGDGLIAVSHVDSLLRIRTEEHDDDAV